MFKLCVCETVGNKVTLKSKYIHYKKLHVKKKPPTFGIWFGIPATFAKEYYKIVQ